MATRKQSGQGGWSYEAIKLLLRDRPVAYHPIIARKLGSVTAGLLLSQLLYWQDKGNNEDGWIHKTQAEIEYETGLGRREQETARKVCRKAGVYEDKRMGAPAKLYHRPNVDRLIELLAEDPDEGPNEPGNEPDSPEDQDSRGEKHPEQNDAENPCKSQNGGKRQTRMAESAKLEWRDQTNKDGGKCQSLYTSETTPESTGLPSVGPSGAPAREGSPTDGEAGPTDRLTDRQTEENFSVKTSESSKSVQFLETPETQQDDEQRQGLSPKEDEDNAAPKPEEALRKQVEAILTSEVSEEARQLTGELLQDLPALSERDRLRTARLTEHYQRREQIGVLRIAASGVALYATQQRIRHPFSYLLACCVDAEGERSEADEDLLASLSGENSTPPSAQSESAGYERFVSESEQQSNAGEEQQRQHTPEPDPEALAVWEKILEDVAGEINAPSLGVWFEGTVPVSLSVDTLTVSVPNGFARDYIESRFAELLEGALAKRLSPTSSLEIVVGVEGSTNNTERSNGA